MKFAGQREARWLRYLSPTRLNVSAETELSEGGQTRKTAAIHLLIHKDRNSAQIVGAPSRLNWFDSRIRLDVLMPAVFALAVAYAHFNFIQNHFATGAYKSVGRISFLAYENSIFLKSAKFFILDGSTFYMTHIAPILFILSLPSYLLPFDRIDNVSLIFGLQGALLVMAGAITVLALRLPLRPLLLGALAALTGVALSFSAQSLIMIGYPHFESFFGPLAILFFVVHAARWRILSAMLFALVLAVREDTGFHMFGVISLLIAYERIIEKASVDIYAETIAENQ